MLLAAVGNGGVCISSDASCRHCLFWGQQSFLTEARQSKLRRMIESAGCAPPPRSPRLKSQSSS